MGIPQMDGLEWKILKTLLLFQETSISLMVNFPGSLDLPKVALPSRRYAVPPKGGIPFAPLGAGKDVGSDHPRIARETWGVGRMIVVEHGI